MPRSWTALGLVVALSFSSFAAASAAPGRPTHVETCATLSPGAAGPAVVTIQQLVRTTPDGDFGPLTATAVRHWQRRHHVKATGAVDTATWAALPKRVRVEACGQPVHGSGVAFSCAVLATGATGPAVEVLQDAVKADVDGEFGPLTAAAVQAAQRKAKLKASGRAGPATWAALGLTATPACVTAPAADPSAAPGDAPAAADGSDSAASEQPAPPHHHHLTKAEKAHRKAVRAIRAQVSTLAADLLAAAPSDPSPVAAAALHFAKRQKGKPYRYGAEGPKSYDCSGLVLASYLHAGLTLPRVAADQYAGGGQQVPLDQARPGDLLFYASDLTDPRTIHHVVIYLGRGRVIDAPYTGAYVGTRPMWTNELLPVAVRPAGQLAFPLEPGGSGWTVGQLQQALNRHGAHLSVDGGYGPHTLAAVKAWKAKHDLRPTGRITLKTWLILV